MMPTLPNASIECRQTTGQAVPVLQPELAKRARALRKLCTALIAPLLIVGCASSADVKQDNAAIKSAKSTERRAAQAFAAGDFASAAASYAVAALVYEALALPEPQARARLSQARALGDAGQVADAQKLVANLLQNTDGLSVDVQTTAHGRAAALALGSDVTRAAAHVQSALQLCANTCAQRSAITVLRARTELAANNPSAAAASASAALTAAQLSSTNSAQANNDRANALRARAQAQLALGQAAAALVDAQQALQLDQDLGFADRVALDLDLLQRASSALGDSAGAARYGDLAQRSAAAGRTLSTGRAP